MLCNCFAGRRDGITTDRKLFSNAVIFCNVAVKSILARRHFRIVRSGCFYVRICEKKRQAP